MERGGQGPGVAWVESLAVGTGGAEQGGRRVGWGEGVLEADLACDVLVPTFACASLRS